MNDDIVAELDRWLAWYEEHNREPANNAVMVLRARGEIVALRQRCALHDDLEFMSANELNAARTEERERAMLAAIRKEPS